MDIGKNYVDVKCVEVMGFCVGQLVFYNKFGEGVIMMLEGEGVEVCVQIKFNCYGVKMLVLGIVKLDLIN